MNYEELSVPYLFQNLTNQNKTISRECNDLLQFNFGRVYGQDKRILNYNEKVKKYNKAFDKKKNNFFSNIQTLASISKDRPINGRNDASLKFQEVKQLRQNFPLFYTYHVEFPYEYSSRYRINSMAKNRK